MSGAIQERAPAKLNLYLHVVGRRADGFHELDSLTVFAGGDEAGDSLRFEPADDLVLTVEGPMAGGLTGEADNLVLRAARALAQAHGIAPKARITLTKRLPIASGIGGGSADAAAALRGLVRLWTLAPDPRELAQLALGLGADVPVCLAGRAVFMGGIGEILEPAPALPTAWLLLANPGKPLATPAVFKARSGPFSAPARFDRSPADAAQLAQGLALRRNDLEEPALRLIPDIAQLKAEIAAQSGCLLARMSGSGATCFGLFAARSEAEAAARSLARPGRWLAVAPLVG
ncbi:MAG: 4-(cytidine 5'-diphospho)-2-C-methyl-D-erythritol kinase [Rhodospirillales bacterium]|nr:4-(cytidine 5'-diphospho)-2-C-methyl-D-erythritol kinase [Rhodospirillales bacterium]